MANHYLFEPVACAPAAGLEKDQVENQVSNIREWLFAPTPKFHDFAALNVWLAQRCRELAQRIHPEQKDRRIAAWSTVRELAYEKTSLLITTNLSFRE